MEALTTGTITTGHVLAAGVSVLLLAAMAITALAITTGSDQPVVQWRRNKVAVATILATVVAAIVIIALVW